MAVSTVRSIILAGSVLKTYRHRTCKRQILLELAVSFTLRVKIETILLGTLWTMSFGGTSDDELVEELEKMKLNSYNINKEKDISALRIRYK